MHGTSLDDNIVGYHFRDRERELIERQIEFERELDQERLDFYSLFFCTIPPINSIQIYFTELKHWPHQIRHYRSKLQWPWDRVVVSIHHQLPHQNTNRSHRRRPSVIRTMAIGVNTNK